MIVTEYMENGALDRYLRVSPPYTIFGDTQFGKLAQLLYLDLFLGHDTRVVIDRTVMSVSFCFSITKLKQICAPFPSSGPRW